MIQRIEQFSARDEFALTVTVLDSAIVIDPGTFVIEGKEYTLTEQQEVDVVLPVPERTYVTMYVAQNEVTEEVVVIAEQCVGSSVRFDFANSGYKLLFRLGTIRIEPTNASLADATGTLFHLTKQQEADNGQGN